jgi:GNAT superfamily N-acetyltransferase
LVGTSALGDTVTIQPKRSQLARIQEQQIAPYWGSRFRRLLPLARAFEQTPRSLPRRVDQRSTTSRRALWFGHLIGAELESLAVLEPWRGLGLGQLLVQAGIAHARDRGEQWIVVATAAAKTRLLRFYQRLGFRLTHVERDVFTPSAGYPADLRVDGIRILDRVWAALEVARCS